MMANNATETISIRNMFYVHLKEGKTIEEINAKKYEDYKKYADFFGVFDNESRIILDEISNQSYTKSQLLSDGLYDIIGTDNKTSGWIKKVTDIIYFLRPCTVIQFAVYKDEKYLGGFSGYIRTVGKSGNRYIREPKKLFDALGFISDDSRARSYNCIDADSNKFSFSKEIYYGAYSNSLSVSGLISGFKSSNYKCSVTVSGSEINVVRLDISTTSKGSGDYDPNEKDISEEILVLMKEKYEKYDNVRKMYKEGGLCIFAFEGKGGNGSGKYSGEGNKVLFPDGRYGAMMVVTIGNKVEFVTKQASTLPAILHASIDGVKKGTAIIPDDIYKIQGKRHQGYYAAFGCQTESGSGNLPASRAHLTASYRYKYGANHKESATGVNIHTAPAMVGDLYSTACHTIRSEDYIPFLMATGCVSESDCMAIELNGIDIESSIEFRGEDAYPTQESTSPVYKDKNGKYYTRDNNGMPQFSGLTDFAINKCIENRKAIADKRGIPLTDAEKNQDCYWYMELLCGMNADFDRTGYYVVDRSHMSPEQKKAFFLDDIREA